jgi:hypothetical protein
MAKITRAASRVRATLLLLAAAALVLAPSASARTTLLHLTAQELTFTSFSCTDPVTPSSAMSRPPPKRVPISPRRPAPSTTRSLSTSLPVFDAPCNVVDETAVFTFDTGTITTHSYHQDCPATIRPGPRIDTDFTVSGGTGAFAGATGNGVELASHVDSSPVIYNGTIVF